MRIERLLIASALVLGGCSSAVPDATGDDDAHDGVVALTSPGDVSAELAASAPHDALRVLARVELVYDAPLAAAVDVSTSADGVVWSPWTAGTTDADASTPGTWVADVDADGARYWRVRAHDGGAAPTYLAVIARDAAELVDESTPDADGATTPATGDVAASAAALTSFHIYSFDAAKVGRAWLWLLRACRARGWHGHLSGPRTGLRTYAQQLSLWNAFQNGTGAPAFPPWGPSRHLIRNVKPVGSWYQAVDTDDVPNLIRIARGLGISLHTPYLPQEPWHVESIHAFGPPRGWSP